MVIKEAVQIGDPLLRAKAKKVTNPTSKEVKKVIADLRDSMAYHELVGMAAPQIGKKLRIFVSEIRTTKNRKAKGDPFRVYIDPEIKWRSREQASDYEGCGSVIYSMIFGKVRRPKAVIVRARDEKGKKFELKASGLLARVIQHENDHLNGVLFTDKADPKTFLSRWAYIAKFKKK